MIDRIPRRRGTMDAQGVLAWLRRSWMAHVAGLMLVSPVMSGCVGDRLSPDAVLTAEAEGQTRAALELIVSGDMERIRPAMTGFAVGEEIDATLITLRAVLDERLLDQPHGDFLIVHAENRRSSADADGVPIHFAVYEAQRAEDAVQIEIAVVDAGSDGSGISFVGVRHVDTPVAGAHDFRTAPLTLGRLAFLVGMMANVAFIVITVGFIVTDRTRSRRWPWVLFALFGSWGLALDWTTGAVAPNFLVAGAEGVRISAVKLVLLGAGFKRAAYAAPWVLQIGLPLGALVYWWRRAATGRRESTTADR